MTKGMTPEELKALKELEAKETPDCGSNSCRFALEIRGVRTNFGCSCCSARMMSNWSSAEKYAYVARSAIPLLIAEVERFQSYQQMYTSEHYNTVINECDALKAEVEKLKSTIADRVEIEQEISADIKESLIIKHRLFGELHDAVHYQNTLREERDAAIARCEKLREALELIEKLNDRDDLLIGERLRIASTTASDALAEDDRESGG